MFCTDLYVIFKYQESFTMKQMLGGDKMSVLTHTHPHKPLRKINVAICN